MCMAIAHKTDSIRIHFHTAFDIKEMKVRFHLVLYLLILSEVKYYSDKVSLETLTSYKPNRSTKLNHFQCGDNHKSVEEFEYNPRYSTISYDIGLDQRKRSDHEDLCCWLGFAERQLIVHLFYPNRSIEKLHIQ